MEHLGTHRVATSIGIHAGEAMGRPNSQQDSGLLVLGIAAVLGAAAAGWFREPSRREAARERMNSAARTLRQQASRLRHDPGESSAAFLHATDREIERRIRRRLKRVSSHPSLISVHCLDGIATLYGHVLEAEIDGIVTSVAVVPGVREVQNQLELHERADIPGLRREEHMLNLEQPDLRVIAGIAGGALLALGAWRRDTSGALLAAAGAACVVGAMGTERLQSATSRLRRFDAAPAARERDLETREERSFDSPLSSSESHGDFATRH
jgi:hypothetical protein